MEVSKETQTVIVLRLTQDELDRLAFLSYRHETGPAALRFHNQVGSIWAGVPL